MGGSLDSDPNLCKKEPRRATQRSEPWIQIISAAERRFEVMKTALEKKRLQLELMVSARANVQAREMGGVR